MAPSDSHKLERFNNLTIINLPKPTTNQLALLVKRTMQLQISLQDGQIWVNHDQQTAHIEPDPACLTLLFQTCEVFKTSQV